MTPGLAMLLGWTSCFAAAVIVALLRWRADRRVAVLAIGVASLSIAIILVNVGTVMLASAVFVWGGVVAGRVWRDAEARSSATSNGGVGGGEALVAGARASVALERVALALAWSLVGVVGIGTVVRLYVTFGADLSLHPTFGVNTLVLRRVFVDQSVLPMLLTLALLLRTVSARGSTVSHAGRGPDDADAIVPREGGGT